MVSIALGENTLWSALMVAFLKTRSDSVKCGCGQKILLERSSTVPLRVFVREGLVLMNNWQELMRPQGQKQLQVAMETTIEELVRVAGSTGAHQAQAMDDTEYLDTMVEV